MLDKIKEIIEELAGDELSEDMFDEDLFEEGFLDSLTLVELLVILETEFSIVLPPTEFEKPDFSTVNKIQKIVADKVG